MLKKWDLEALQSLAGGHMSQSGNRNFPFWQVFLKTRFTLAYRFFPPKGMPERCSRGSCSFWVLRKLAEKERCVAWRRASPARQCAAWQCCRVRLSVKLRSFTSRQSHICSVSTNLNWRFTLVILPWFCCNMLCSDLSCLLGRYLKQMQSCPWDKNREFHFLCCPTSWLYTVSHF